MGFDYSNSLHQPESGGLNHIQKVKEMGFNLVRIPFAFQTFDDAAGKQNMMNVVKECCNNKILVLFDCHNIIHSDEEFKQAPYFSRSKSGGQISFRGKPVNAAFFGDLWVEFLTAFSNFPNVIGADLFNEPHGETTTWGDGGENDWKRDTEDIGKKILDNFKGRYLIFVEGISHYGGVSGQWGGMLRGVKDKPIKIEGYPNKVVYAPTAYGPDLYGHQYPKDASKPHQGRLFDLHHDKGFPDNMVSAIWSADWGFIHEQKLGAVMIKEWGGHMGFRHINHNLKASHGGVEDAKLEADAFKDALWTDRFIKYVDQNKLDHVYWVLYNGLESDVGSLLDDGGNVTKAKVPTAGGSSEASKLSVIQNGQASGPPVTPPAYQGSC